MPRSETALSVGFLSLKLSLRILTPRFARDDKTPTSRDFFVATTRSPNTTLTMRCHIFSIDHKSLTTKSRFRSEKNRLNPNKLRRFLRNSPAAANFKRMRTPEDRRRFMLGCIFAQHKKNPNLFFQCKWLFFNDLQ